MAVLYIYIYIYLFIIIIFLNTEIGKHFNSANHQGLQNVEINFVDFIQAHPAGEKSRYLRNLIEFNWIQRMHTNAHTDLNVMDPL